MIPEYRGTDRDPAESQSLETVPFYRTERFVFVLILASCCCFPPLLWWACLICLTGDVYREKLGPDGRRLRWSWVNKVAAVTILVLQVIGFIMWLERRDRER